MTRCIFHVALLGLASVVAGCEKSAADAQDTTNKARAEANQTAANAKTEADTKAKNAQAEADKKIAEVQGDFAKTREDYRHSVQSKLDALDKKIAVLEADAKKATGKTKTDLDARLVPLRAQRTAFGTEFKALDSTTVATWDATKTRLDKAWNELEAAVEKRS